METMRRSVALSSDVHHVDAFFHGQVLRGTVVHRAVVSCSRLVVFVLFRTCAILDSFADWSSKVLIIFVSVLLRGRHSFGLASNADICHDVARGCVG